ncbi:serine/threonine protein kinase, partial [Myxococcota bacterium]|nr:serine/threonine protein kinase [Myxococcota bacterium]MBU1533681.1 serine/threonine protein kinase [Myxococcota bacterium]
QKRALKLLCFDVVDQERMEMAVSRFFREVGAVASIGHQNIVRVFEFGEDEEGRPYLVMEYLTGRSLFDYIFDSGFPVKVRESLEILRQVAVGIGAAHQSGIIHRDLKSENIFLHTESDGTVTIKILDFGVAKFMNNKLLANISHAQIFGSPGYMAPEQARGLTLDGRTDIYALGIIAFELFTKQLPFMGNTTEVLLAHVQKPVPDPQELNPDIPDAVVDFIVTAMQKLPEKRFQSMEEVASEIYRISQYLPLNTP